MEVLNDTVRALNLMNLMFASTGSQWSEIKRGVTWALLGWLKTRCTIIICRGLIMPTEHCSGMCDTASLGRR